MNTIIYKHDDQHLTADTFLKLVNRVWPGEYSPPKTRLAIEKTINVTAWDQSRLVGCVRLLTDGYFFSTVTEILVDPDYQKQGIGARLMKMVWEESPCSLSFGVQPGNEPFFEKLGFERGLPSYQKKKARG